MNRVCGFLAILILASCSNYGQLTFITKLPKRLDENSGIVALEHGKIWVIEDNGNPDELYEVNFEGQLLKKLKVSKAQNGDWEDLAKDEDGNLYIADIGNNDNKRKQLAIYKVPNPTGISAAKIRAEKITFNYPEQKKFPPQPENLKYDAEGLIYFNKYLYVFTKSRARPYKGEALIYKIPAQTGNFKAELVGKLNLCDDPNLCSVTAAALSADAKKLVLLGYGKLWIISDFKEDFFASGRIKTIDHGATTQLEAVCFLNDSTLLLSDEQSHGSGRNLYSFQIK